ncbi:MAG: hypothetical protein LBQ10_12010 [Desulfovibrio sp.]|jgi:hypothetical protein|nr:hypothetical protein [Desulfovibrio sp.]
MPIVKKTFTVMGGGGTAIYHAGAAVGEDIAARFPRFMEGYGGPASAVRHNPKLPMKLNKKEADKLSEADLIQWIMQYHPGNVPPDKTDKAELVDIVLRLQG